MDIYSTMVFELLLRDIILLRSYLGVEDYGDLKES